ncbi:MAG TPA: enediyne biosynthesis protein UnbU [Deltaproteobacteria bacterium]|nr:enediyne biosynthesis protein UnbU [Deltaproteobacteria bacterium]
MSRPNENIRSGPDPRMGLKISATTATLFALAGHAFLGFEQSFLQLLVAVLAGYASALLLEVIDARSNQRPPLFAGGGPRHVAFFLAPAHMTAVTTSFLLYVNDALWPMVFAVVAAVGSKYIFKLTIRGRKRHFMNPSNFGIALTLLLFHQVAVIPYEYTEGMYGRGGAGDWILPLAIVVLGSNLNVRFTRRVPLIVTFLATFALQAIVRAWTSGAPLLSGLMPMTGVAFLLFTFYMITDPMTSPASLRGQIVFGASISLIYMLLMFTHVIFTLFFSVTLVCALRGAWIAFSSWQEARGGELQRGEATGTLRLSRVLQGVKRV